MKIAIDMDNTLIDEFGSTLRPGIISFLDAIRKNNELILWTNSRRLRALEMVDHFNLRNYFVKIISRENYDPDEKGLRKDLRKYNYDIIIDDDPEEIEYNKNNGKTGILVETYRKNTKLSDNELNEILVKYKL
jgi:phosphoglycolate phosphatase-like HAD superfamily hydrolase